MSSIGDAQISLGHRCSSRNIAVCGLQLFVDADIRCVADRGTVLQIAAQVYVRCLCFPVRAEDCFLLYGHKGPRLTPFKKKSYTCAL